jgi:hypothetical protein
MKNEQKLGIGGLDWNNVDLTDGYERSRNIIEPLSFDVLLLECEHNIRTLSEAAIREQFERDLRDRTREAREIFNANLSNILKEAEKYRSED